MTSAIALSSNETLIATGYKLINHGQLTFLIFINSYEVKEVVYGYSVNIKNEKATCLKMSEKIYKIRNKKVFLRNRLFQTAEEFKRSQSNTWREKYYKCFTKDFLDKTNDEKIDFLNELDKKHSYNY
jgi:hypothetical protein